MRTRSQSRSRSLADLPAGSGCASGSGSGAGAGSERMMTRGRRWRLRAANLLAACAGSEAIATDLGGAPTNQYQSRCSWEVEAGRPRKQQTARFCGGQTEAATESEWKDWANLPSELLEDIAGRLLSVDVSEYLRFRSACKPWREYTEDPRSCRGGLDRRFRPRNWIAVSHCASPSRRSLVNVSTGARVEVDHPELSAHHYLGVADGLLVLCHKTSKTIGLLNPFTGAITHFPPITDVRATAPQHDASTRVIRAFYFRSEPRTEEDTRLITEALKVDIPELDDPSIINGAAIDDSTSMPTLVLGLRRWVNRIICAKPGDQHWVSVHYGEQEYSLYNWNDRISFNSLLSLGGHCYVATTLGDLMMVDLCPQTAAKGPRMVYVFRETELSFKIAAYSYLIRSLDERMLMVRFLSSLEDFSRDHYEQTEMFTLNDGRFARMELLEVDLTRRQLIPLRGIVGNYAAFVGGTYTVMLSADKFPKLAADAVYFNCFLQRLRHLGIYHFKDRRISPPKDLRPDACPGGSAHPCACHWELDDYLVCDIERGHNL